MGYLHRVSKLGAFVVSIAHRSGGVCDVGMEIGDSGKLVGVEF